MKLLKAKLGKANSQLSSSGMSQLSTLLQVKEGRRMQHSLGAECNGGFGVASGEPQRKEKLLGKEFCHSNREPSALFLSFQLLLGHLNLDALSTPRMSYVESQTLDYPSKPTFDHFSASVQGTTILLVFDLLFFFA